MKELIKIFLIILSFLYIISCSNNIKNSNVSGEAWITQEERNK